MSLCIGTFMSACTGLKGENTADKPLAGEETAHEERYEAEDAQIRGKIIRQTDKEGFPEILCERIYRGWG